MKRTLVLPGGGIAGGFQAGALDELLPRHGYDYAYGISVGALNGVLAALWLEDPVANPLPGEFWLRNVERPRDLFRIKNAFRVATAFVTGRLEGLLSPRGLDELLREIDWGAVLRSPLDLEVGVVNMHSGQLEYRRPSQPYFREAVLASSSIPVIFPLVEITDGLYADGGVREVVPLRPAIDAGADAIDVLVCHAPTPIARNVNRRDQVEIASRAVDLMTLSLVEGDIRRAESINRMLRSPAAKSVEELRGKRHIDIRVIRPDFFPGVSVMDFDARGIRGLVEAGRAAAAAL